MRYKFLLLLAAISFITQVEAQNKPSSIAGTVKDSRTKAPLIEAVITVSSPALQGKKFAVTDSLGKYKFLNLPAGIYAVSFEMEGFRKYTQDSVKLVPGMSMGVSFEMARDRGPIQAERTRFRKREVVKE